MTNHEQRIILAWLEAERVRVLAAFDVAPNIDDMHDLHDEYNFLVAQHQRVAALDTSRPALTDDERKAQAAGIMGKMSRNRVA